MDTKNQTNLKPNLRPETILELFRRTEFDLRLVGAFQRGFRDMLYDPRLPVGVPTRTYPSCKAFGIREFVIREITASDYLSWTREKFDTLEGIYFPEERIFIVIRKDKKWASQKAPCFSKKVRERFANAGVLFETEVPPVTVFIIEYSTDKHGLDLSKLTIRRLGTDFLLGPKQDLYPLDRQETLLPGLFLDSNHERSSDRINPTVADKSEDILNGRVRSKIKRDSDSPSESGS